MTFPEAVKVIGTIQIPDDENKENILDAFGVIKKEAEKRIPKKPIALDDELSLIMYIWECPTCGKQRIDGKNARGAYCQECGQAIDWSDQDDV